MKKFWFLLLLVPLSSHAGMFVDKSLYVTRYLAVGKGKTLAEAERDARSAIPAPTPTLFYEPDSSHNSPEYQCVDAGFFWSERNECGGADVQETIPLRRIQR
jgi:hypothetical protein